tara:strand:+ start:162 stop:365 length:204 start_codon:yes stop_codon:yes gene_type:complete
MDNFSISLTEKIEKVLEEFSECEVNLGSEAGRKLVAERIMKIVNPAVEGRIKALTSEVRILKNMGQI